MDPFPFTSLVPRGRRVNPGPSAAATRSVTWICPGSPWDSMRLAVFTVSPQKVVDGAPADHSCHHRSCVDPDPDREPAQSGLLGDRRDLVPHRERHAGDRLEVVGPWLWQPAGHRRRRRLF